jgi:hypothetical protein
MLNSLVQSKWGIDWLVEWSNELLINLISLDQKRLCSGHSFFFVSHLVQALGLNFLPNQPQQPVCAILPALTGWALISRNTSKKGPILHADLGGNIECLLTTGDHSLSSSGERLVQELPTVKSSFGNGVRNGGKALGFHKFNGDVRVCWWKVNSESSCRADNCDYFRYGSEGPETEVTVTN